MKLTKCGITVISLLIFIALSISCASIQTVPSKPTEKPPISYSHIGFVESWMTGNNHTLLIFKDGYQVELVGEMRGELIPPIGTKVEIKYYYDSHINGNILSSLEAVP